MTRPVRAKGLLTRNWHKVAEITLIYCMVIVTDRFILSDNAFFGWNPNPLWLPVILFSTLYGTLSGVCSALISGVYWFFQSRNINFPGDILEQTFQRSIQPMLWYATAIAIGEVTISRQRRLSRLTTGGKADKQKIRKLADYLTQLHGINRALQIRIATNNRNIAESLAIGSELATARLETFPAIFHRMVSYALKTDQFDCFIEWQGRTRFPFNHGTAQISQDAARDLCSVLNQIRSVVTAADPSIRSFLPNGAAAAIPLFQNDNVIGAIVIYDLDFCDLNAEYVAEMRILSAWCSTIIPSIISKIDIYQKVNIP